MDKKYTLGKHERLRSQKAIQGLFHDGKSLFHYPFRLVWQFSDNTKNPPAQVAFSVSKRRLRKAVQRNRVKRQLREIYRHKKPCLYDFLDQNQQQIQCMIIYIEQKHLDYKQMSKSFDILLTKLINKMNKD